MVATMASMTTASDAEKLALITGSARVATSDISAKLWVTLLLEVLECIPLKNMLRQCPSMRLLLEGSARGLTPMRQIPNPEMIRLALEGAGIANVTHFLQCSDSTLISSDWRNAPRKENWQAAAARGESALEDIYDLVLVVPILRNPTQQRFYRVDATWSPVEHWDDDSMSSMPDQFHYELSRLEVFALNDVQLSHWAHHTSASGEPAGVRVLCRLMQAMQMYQDGLESELRHTQESHGKIERILRTIGF